MSGTLEEQLRNAVNSVPGWSWDEVDVAPLDGGVTNANFVAIKDGKKTLHEGFWTRHRKLYQSRCI